MQTFSDMRRNSTYYRTINAQYIYFVLALAYAQLASMFLYLSPLIGVAFYFLSEHFEDEEYEVINLLILLYIAFVEINQGLFLFSFLIFFLLFYRLAFKMIKESIVCALCMPIIYVVIGYLGYYLFNLLLSALFNYEPLELGLTYLVFIISDILLVFILL